MAVDMLIACVVMLASANADSTVPPRMGRSTGRGLYLFVEDVGAIFAVVVDAGATGVLAAETTEWGSERARILDPEGHEWSFGTREPGGRW
jgi:uncharacterized glyoxalase superfamily protein PhnB